MTWGKGGALLGKGLEFEETSMEILYHIDLNYPFTPYPQLLFSDDFIKREITSISTGENHLGLVTEKGQAYVWGDNSYGQLGIKTEGR
jgi:alpha-tubulin suppressor-like RCC1 family protein